VYVTTQNRVISPKTRNQKIYIDAIRKNDIVFGNGPAGTGKTYLAVTMAVSALATGEVRSIILTRPAVEAGEKLGFLPGDLAQKVNPYLRPLHDALNDLLGPERAADLIEQDVIEIAPLAFMRGRTLSNAFIILDEAQNTTKEQMKMFLTRIGFDSKAVITGDSTQIDLPVKTSSGLIQAKKLLSNIDGISFCTFTQQDVVRHPLVQQIINAYENN
jgi:phosphate starvation-inducible PhoH-like protein